MFFRVLPRALQRLPGVLILSLFVFAVLTPKGFPKLFALYFVLLHLALLVQSTRNAFAVREGN
jgi:hypothetical protein